MTQPVPRVDQTVCLVFVMLFDPVLTHFLCQAPPPTPKHLGHFSYRWACRNSPRILVFRSEDHFHPPDISVNFDVYINIYFSHTPFAFLFDPFVINFNSYFQFSFNLSYFSSFILHFPMSSFSFSTFSPQITSADPFPPHPRHIFQYISIRYTYRQWWAKLQL